MKKQRIESLQMLRAVAAVLIVVWHSHLVLKYAVNNYWPDGNSVFRACNFPAIFNHLYIGVDIFFCISGYIMCMLSGFSMPGLSSAADFAFKRVVRIYPPYWCFTAVVIVTFIVSRGSFNMGHLSGVAALDLPRTAYSLILLPSTEVPILGVGWTLVHEMLFYFFCAFLIALGLNCRIPEFLFGLSLVSVVFFVMNISVLYGYGFSPFSIEFLFGALAYRLTSKWHLHPLISVSMAIGVYIFACSSFDSGILPASSVIFRSIFGGLVGFLLILGLQELDSRFAICNTYWGRLFLRVGNASYSLYLSHWLVLSVAGKLVRFWPAIPSFLLAAWHLCSVIIAIYLSVILSERFEIPLHNVFLKIRLSLGNKISA